TMWTSSRAGDQDVEPPSAARAAERSESAVKFSRRIRAVGRADDDVIAFVALNVLQILDEQPLERPADPPQARLRQRGGEGGIGFRQFVELVEDQVALRDVEAGDADARRLGSSEEVANNLPDLRRLHFVLPALVNSVDTVERQRRVPRAVRRMARDRLKPRAVKIAVAEVDQVGVARAVVNVEIALLDLDVQRRAQ